MSAKPCKYGCGQTLTWDTANSRFVEESGVPHSKERCESLKGKSTQAKPTSSPAVKPTLIDTQALIELAKSINHLADSISALAAVQSA